MTSRAWAGVVLLGGPAALWIATRAGPDAPPFSCISGWPIERFALNAALSVAALWTWLALLSKRPSRALARGAMVLGTLTALLALLESPAYLRWLDWSEVVGPAHSERYTRVPPWRNPANLRDEDLLFRHRPGWSFSGTAQGDLVLLYGIATERSYPVEVRYDERGFRNPPGMTRADVVLIGDSFLEWALTPDAELVSARLAERTGLSVANLGHTGYGPQQELIVLKRHGLALRPRHVVWFFFEGNDLVDARRYVDALHGRDPLDPSRTRFLERSLVHNLLLRLAARTERGRKEDSIVARERVGVFTRGPGPARMYFAYSGEPLDEGDRRGLDLALPAIREAARVAGDAGAAFLVAYLPTKLRVHHGLVEFAPGTRAAAWRPNELPRLVREELEAAGIPFVDLTTALRAAAEQGELVYLLDDGHWTARGHDVVARALAPHLR